MRNKSEFVRNIVREFYIQIQADEVLGSILSSHIADFDAHWERMDIFWQDKLLGIGEYVGSPIPYHMRIRGLEVCHFRRWLLLWREKWNAVNDKELKNKAGAVGLRYATAFWRAYQELNISRDSWLEIE